MSVSVQGLRGGAGGARASPTLPPVPVLLNKEGWGGKAV